MIFLEATHISLIQQYICQQKGLDLLSILEKKAEFAVDRARLENWFELQSFSQSDDIFSSEEKTLLVDLQDLQPANNLEQLFKANSKKLFFWSSTVRAWPTSLQKIWATLSGKYIKLSLNESVAGQIYTTLSDKNGLQLNRQQLASLVSSCSDYQELVDKIDFLSLSPNLELAFSWIKPDFSPELFTLPLRPNNLKADLSKWLELVTEADVQLALSLLWTKSMKFPSGDIKQLIIKADSDIKTRSKLSPMLVFKRLVAEISGL